MEITNIVNNVLLQFPLFGSVIVGLNFEHTNRFVPAPAFTDGRTIFYRDDFFQDYTDEEREFIIAHEVMHIVFNHVFRNLDMDPDLLNYVEDAIINQFLVKSGMTMPEGCVNVLDALDYSAEELYMKNLYRIDEIKEWMQVNTYHIVMDAIDDVIGEMYANDLNELMNTNDEIRNGLFEDMEGSIKKGLSSMGIPLGLLFPMVNLGTSPSFADWKHILRKSLLSDDSNRIYFYEIEPDGILRKEYKDEDDFSENEVVIDTSASMSMAKIKAILRECKNIFKDGSLRVGFCDAEFYGWKDIKSVDDIDKLEITGRGGTDFSKMAAAFSSGSHNKIVITDGWGIFPKDRDDILWIILETKSMFEMLKSVVDLTGVNYVFIDSATVQVPKEEKKLIRK